MSFGISVSPARINKGEAAIATVTLPAAADQTVVVKFETLAGALLGSAEVVVHIAQPTVGVEGSGADYIVRAEGLVVTKIGDFEFSLQS